MGSDYAPKIPVIDFSNISLKSDRESKEWQHLCSKVREACEDFGCFEVVFHDISPQSQAEAFSALKELFALPLETKKKNVNPNPYHAYAGRNAVDEALYEKMDIAQLFESCGIEDASNFDSLMSFAKLMWPEGNDRFSQPISYIIKAMEDLNHTIEMSILDSLDLGDKVETVMPCKTLMRVMKYDAPPNGQYMNGLNPHTDKPFYALLCSDQVFGLEIETKDGHWIPFTTSPNSFMFIVGDAFMVWSNGRLHSAKHRVMMKGHEDRYSLAAFPIPLEGLIIKPAKELVNEANPPKFKEFEYMDYLKFTLSDVGIVTEPDKQIFAFAGKC